MPKRRTQQPPRTKKTASPAEPAPNTSAALDQTAEAIESLRGRVEEQTKLIDKLRADAELPASQISIIQRVLKTASYDLQYVQAALDCIDRWTGSTSPVEEFLHDVLFEYTRGTLTPESAEIELEEFKADWEVIIKTARRLRTDLLSAAAESEESHA